MQVTYNTIPLGVVSQDVLNEKYIKNGETTIEQIFDRVAKQMASVEKPEDQERVAYIGIKNSYHQKEEEWRDPRCLYAGRGSLLGIQIIPDSFYDDGYINNGMMTMPAMALILLGCVIWIHRAFFSEKD